MLLYSQEKTGSLQITTFHSDIRAVRVSGVRDLPHLATLVKAYATLAGVPANEVTIVVHGNFQRLDDRKDFTVSAPLCYFETAMGESVVAFRMDGLLQLFRAIGTLEATFEV